MTFPSYGTFQGQINDQPAPAIEGDFASDNPVASLLAAPGSLQAGPLGVIVGRCAFAENDNQALPGVVSNKHAGVPSRLGFVGRAQAGALITAFLGSSTLTVQSGYEITLYNSGDFWGRFAAGASVGQKVYASYVDGSLSAAAAGAPTTAAATASFATNVMTVTVPGGVLGAGMPVTSAGVAAGTYITAQTGGTTGGAGTYTLSTAPGTIASQAATITTNLESNFTVQSTAAATELAQISSRP